MLAWRRRPGKLQSKEDHTMQLPPVVDYLTEKTFPNPGNFRSNLELATILPSIQAHGILQPLGGWLDKVRDCCFLIWGHRRLMAARELKLPTVPIRLFPEEPPPSQVALYRALENFARADQKPSERAAECRALIQEQGITARELSQQLGISGATISRYLALLEQPLDIIRLVDSGDVAITVANLVGRLPDA